MRSDADFSATTKSGSEEPSFPNSSASFASSCSRRLSTSWRAAAAARASAFACSSSAFSASSFLSSASIFSAAARASAAAFSAAAIRSCAARSSAFFAASSRGPSVSPGRSVRFPRPNPSFSGWSRNRASSSCSAERLAMAAVPTTVATMAPTTAPNFMNPFLLMLDSSLHFLEDTETGRAGALPAERLYGGWNLMPPERSPLYLRHRGGRPNLRGGLQMRCREQCRYRDRQLRGHKCNRKYRIHTS